MLEQSIVRAKILNKNKSDTLIHSLYHRYGVEAAVAMGCIFGDQLECLQNKSPEA